MLGAPALVAHAGLRAGCGRVIVMAPASVLPGVLTICPSATGRAMPEQREVEAGGVLSWSESLQAVVLGPGLGRGGRARCIVQQHLTSEGCPLVVDADALHLMAGAGCMPSRRHVVLTPHPGEFSALAKAYGVTVGGGAAADRSAAASALADRLGCVVVLKGHGTVVAGSGVWVDHCGGVELAIPGSGDVLAGLLGSILAQQAAAGEVACEDAARLAVEAHGRAGVVLARRRGVRGIMALELADAIPAALEQVG